MSNEPDKIIYSMIRVSKRHGQKEVLKDISLSYFYGAKIGVLGLNGAGKSSLLKILAGVDQDLVKVDIALFDNGRQPDNFRSGTDDGHEFEFVHIAPLF